MVCHLKASGFCWLLNLTSAYVECTNVFHFVSTFLDSVALPSAMTVMVVLNVLLQVFKL